MKKILYPALAIALIGMASCHKNDESAETNGAINAKIVNDFPDTEIIVSEDSVDGDYSEEIKDEVQQLEISSSLEDEEQSDENSQDEIKEEKKADKSADKKHDEATSSNEDA
ncbi:MAG: hypothetical protein NC217_06285 [Muribaculaceae bacterium]|nr:hypothetical protein [Muribaculaceae bacterium]